MDEGYAVSEREGSRVPVSATRPGPHQVRVLLLDAARFTRWAPPGLQVRPTSSPSSVRYTDIDGHTVSIWLTQKPGPRCTVAVQVEGLRSEEARGAAKTAWGEHLRHLKALADGD